MSYPVSYAYYPFYSRDNGVIYSRANAINSAWREGVKGVPIPFTGSKQWRKDSEGDMSTRHYNRRDRGWVNEWDSEGDAYSVAEWFSSL